MPHSNGKQTHLSTAEIIAKAKAQRSRPWHWDALDMDFLIRPRSTAENAAVVDESEKLMKDVEELAGTADAPGSLEGYRLRLRAALPCILHPDDQTPVFDHESIEPLLELDTPALNELLEAVDRVSNFTSAQAEAAAKNSAATGGDNSSSTSPVAAETSTSSPTPTP